MKSRLIRNGITVFILGICLILTGCGNKDKVKEEIPLVRSQVVKLDGLSESATYSGEVRGRYESQLAFQVSGKIIRRNVDLGSIVQAGDVLMEVDPKDIQQTVSIGSAQVYAAESQLRLAESNLHRYQQLYEQNAISRAQYDQYQNAYDSALAAVQQAAAQYAQSSNQLGYSALYADSGGVISAVNAEAGQVVSAGQTVITLVRDGEREVEIDVPENRLAELRAARQIRVAFWALPARVVDGKVREIAPMADKVSRTYKVRISLIDPPPEMKLGMTAAVTIGNAGSGRAAYIPLSAIYQTGDSPCVWVIENGVVRLKPVTLGAFGDGQVELLAGLQDGEMLVTAGVHKLREGQQVKTAGEGQ